MQVSQPNNIKIYNLSAGKSLPEWISERKRRMLQKNDIDIRRRIELIQDFEMPTASTCIRVSPDHQYIMASGVYKPRLRCYETSQLSMKFERCLDSEIVKFQILSEDYTKIAFLNCDRHIEFHAQYGRYYRTRIPKFGRDLVYHYPSCELYLVGASSDVYRLNLEQGRFLNSLQTNASSINVCSINPVHNLFAAGTVEGCVECWDPRSRSSVGVLDTGLCKFSSENRNTVPAVTALSFNGALAMGVGTNTGHVLLYDLRSSQPLVVKDHQYGLPIKSLTFQQQHGVVLSADSKILKIWDKDTGKPFTSIESQSEINDLCLFKDSGLLFLATESPKMKVYFIPSLGPAPQWCAFLDNLTEELEEDELPTVYDDYKFVTKEDLNNLGLLHLIGTNLLRGYMHGYFMDIRLFHKAKAIAEPFAYDEYRKKRIQEKLDQERKNRVKLKKLPKINRNLAEKLLDESNLKKKNKKGSNPSDLLQDERFSAMFTNPDFQVDEESEEFKLLHPVMSKHDAERERRRREKQEQREHIFAQFREIEGEELKGRASEEESSSDDELIWRKTRKLESNLTKMNELHQNKPKFFELKGEETLNANVQMRSKNLKTTKRMTMADRLRQEEQSGTILASGSCVGEKEITFKMKKTDLESKQIMEARTHRKERKQVRRSAASILSAPRKGPVFWRGKKIK